MKQFTLEVKPEHLERSVEAFRRNVGASLSRNCPISFALADKFPADRKFWKQHEFEGGVPVAAHMFELIFGEDGMEKYDLDSTGAAIIDSFDGVTFGQLSRSHLHPFVEWGGPALPCTVTFTEYER